VRSRARGCSGGRCRCKQPPARRSPRPEPDRRGRRAPAAGAGRTSRSRAWRRGPASGPPSSSEPGSGSRWPLARGSPCATRRCCARCRSGTPPGRFPGSRRPATALGMRSPDQGGSRPRGSRPGPSRRPSAGAERCPRPGRPARRPRPPNPGGRSWPRRPARERQPRPVPRPSWSYRGCCRSGCSPRSPGPAAAWPGAARSRPGRRPARRAPVRPGPSPVTARSRRHKSVSGRADRRSPATPLPCRCGPPDRQWPRTLAFPVSRDGRSGAAPGPRPRSAGRECDTWCYSGAVAAAACRAAPRPAGTGQSPSRASPGGLYPGSHPVPGRSSWCLDGHCALGCIGNGWRTNPPPSRQRTKPRGQEAQASFPLYGWAIARH
jgi:hypothetical protein